MQIIINLLYLEEPTAPEGATTQRTCTIVEPSLSTMPVEGSFCIIKSLSHHLTPSSPCSSLRGRLLKVVSGFNLSTLTMALSPLPRSWLILLQRNRQSSNGIAERDIHTITYMARPMFIHTSMRSPSDTVTANHWPMAWTTQHGCTITYPSKTLDFHQMICGPDPNLPQYKRSWQDLMFRVLQPMSWNPSFRKAESRFPNGRQEVGKESSWALVPDILHL